MRMLERKTIKEAFLDEQNAMGMFLIFKHFARGW